MTTINNQGMLATSDPSVTLPPLDRIGVPAVASAAEKYFGLHDSWQEQGLKVQQAERAFYDAEAADEQATSLAIEAGKATPDPRARAKQAAETLDDEKARLAAFRTAVVRAAAVLRDVVAQHQAEWTEHVSSDHAAAVARLSAAQDEMRAAERDLVYTGSVLNMLATVGKVTAGVYRPAAVLQLATRAGTEALDAVTSHAS